MHESSAGPEPEGACRISVDFSFNLWGRAAAGWRTVRPVHIKYWDHFPANISGDLSHKHRYAVKEAIDDYDFFISGEGE